MSTNEIISTESQFNYPKYINIKGYDLNFKQPILKDNIYRYRCRNRQCKYFVKINEKNLHKLLNKEKEIEYTKYNEHENHKENIKVKIDSTSILTEEEINKLAHQLILNNINQTLSFHLENFKNNNINWKINKIRKLLYKIRELKFPKDEIFLSSINLINISLVDNPEIDNEPFCISKGEFVNFNKNNKLEKYIMFASPFQVKLYAEIEELFIDGTCRVAPKQW